MATPTVEPSQNPAVEPAPSSTADPLPQPTTSGVVEVSIRNIRGAKGSVGGTGVWTGSEVLVWGGYWSASFVSGPYRYRRTGDAYDPVRDTWRRIPAAPIVGRYRHLAAWTGKEMLVWGGYPDGGKEVRDGAAYNPRRNRWRTIAPSPLPWSGGAVSVMTDDEWVIGVTIRDQVRFAAYDPGADSWRLLPSILEPITRENSLAWTGTELVLVNSQDRMVRLPEDAPAWIDSAAVPLEVLEIVWTGTELLGFPFALGPHPLYRHDSRSDAWVTVPGPTFERGQMIWTGNRLVVHGADVALDPATGEWFELAWPEDRVPYREDHVSVWTDHGLFEWGGSPGKGDMYNHGALFTPDW